mgnify:CR=1 FL=1
MLINIALFSSLLYADGSVAYKKCSSCHGINGEKAALGKSKILKDTVKVLGAAGSTENVPLMLGKIQVKLGKSKEELDKIIADL